MKLKRIKFRIIFLWYIFVFNYSFTRLLRDNLLFLHYLSLILGKISYRPSRILHLIHCTRDILCFFIIQRGEWRFINFPSSFIRINLTALTLIMNWGFFNNFLRPWWLTHLSIVLIAVVCLNVYLVWMFSTNNFLRRAYVWFALYKALLIHFNIIAF